MTLREFFWIDRNPPVSTFRHFQREEAFVSDRLLQFFSYEHLPPRLREVSANFHNLAVWMDQELPATPERTVAFRKLLEAKDCAVRAQLEGPLDHG